MSIEQAIREVVSEQSIIDNEIKDILTKQYKIDDPAKTEPYRAIGLLVLDVSVKLMNVLRSMRFPDAGLGYRAVLDLTVGLNENQFWQKHAAVLVPLLHIAIQAQSDYAILLLDRAVNPKSSMFDGVRTESQLVGLEIFVMIGYLFGGQELITNSSINVKQALAPYLVT